ncbi:peptidyl-prolyl cis-trans isomerase [Persicobacter psychrovividus]|uniref:Peptidyl-prolyl cis-trans isomerase n=2 Tax=Persicobacter psychrovividus TaxID=387638 RepID=A0ABN6LA56_9BACT|nr:peptidyl-prolyl cis-trans isomerase [Persicobacter psychrovividus]
MNEVAEKGNLVRVHYTGKLEDGTVFDTSLGKEPLEFALGFGQMIRGFEEAVFGMAVGEKKSVTLSPEKAYGEREEQKVVTVPRANLNLPAEMVLEVGKNLQGQTAEGQPFQVMVVALTADSVTLDQNHALAGKHLTFEIELLALMGDTGF